MRCPFCGRPIIDAGGKLTEALLQAEVDRGVTGCLGGPNGCKNPQDHETREIDAYEQKVLAQYANIIAGKHGDDASKALVGTVAEVADAKATAQLRFDALTQKRAVDAALKAAIAAREALP